MDFPGKKIMPRYFIISAVLCIACIAVLCKVFYIMTVEKDFWMQVSERFQRHNIIVPPRRGDILADNGEVLAASIPEYKMFLDFMSWEKDSARRAEDQYRRDTLLFATKKLHLTKKDSVTLGAKEYRRLLKNPPLEQPLRTNLRCDSVCQGLHALFPDIDPEALKAHILEGRLKKSHRWNLYPKRLSYIQYCEVRKLPVLKLKTGRGGFFTDKTQTRKNPYGSLASRTVGDLYGGKDSARSGLEYGLDSILRGKPGMSHTQKVLSSQLSIIDKPAEDGLDVQTTLNVTMQDICEKALGDQLRHLRDENTGEVHFGVCIVMEVATGDVKAITSLSRVKDGNFYEIQNKAISNLMEPGSVFKPMSFLVAFNDGYIHMDDLVNVGNGIRPMYGRKMKDHNWHSGGYGTLTVRQCIQKSSNVGVSHFIDKYYSHDPQRFVDGIKATGVAEDLHIPIPGYAVPKIKTPGQGYWAKTDLPWMSIGYVTQIPPISTLTFYNGIANNGRMMRPRFVKAYLRNGEVVSRFDPVVVREHMASDEAVKNIQTCLREVVTLGVGKKAGSKQVQVAGKTGTAQVWSASGRTASYLVSFAGYFPYDNPKYSCIVCINKDGFASGGTQCGPVFKRVAETIMAQQLKDNYKAARDTVNSSVPYVADGNISAAARVLDRLKTNFSDASAAGSMSLAWGSTQTDGKTVSLLRTEQNLSEVPDVRGFGLRDALYRLEKMGMKVKAMGVGRVTSQSLQPGHKFAKGDEITLSLGHAKPNPVAAPDSVHKQQQPAETEEEALGGADSSKARKQPTGEPAEKPKKKDNKDQRSALSSQSTDPASKKRKV